MKIIRPSIAHMVIKDIKYWKVILNSNQFNVIIMTSCGIFFFFIILWTAVVSPTPILNRGYEPKTNTFDFTIEKVTLAPDGFTRQLSTVNGQYPGPTIEVNRGDRIVMKIHNKLGEPTGNLQQIFSYVLCVVRVFKRILQIKY